MNPLHKGIRNGLYISLGLSILLLLILFALSGCLPMAVINMIKNDVACEAYNSDIERGVHDGTKKVCKEPAWRFPS